MQTAASMYPISTRPSVALLRPSLVYNPGSSCSFPGPIHRGAFVPPVAFGQSTHGSRRRLFPLCQARAGISAASTASSSGGHGGNGDGGSSGHGDGKFGWGRNNMSTAKGPVPSEMDIDCSREDVILLDVRGMKCGGCVGRVKRVLEEVPEVRSASVNLATETALVRVLLPSTDAGGSENAADYLEKLQVTLCKILERIGFKGAVRLGGAGGNAAADQAIADKRAERIERLKDTTRRLFVAGALASTCLLHHVCHIWHGAPPWIGLLGSPPVQFGISAAALLGPGRQILVDGWKGLVCGAPDMNSLVGLGAVASFGMSCIAAAIPGLGWPTFFEEPAMLMGVVLLGRTLEERAKLSASSDMAALQQLVPSLANLVLEGGAVREVPSAVLQVGDIVALKPGDRAPVDGVVVSGASTVDEAALTGEPLPVKKVKGSEIMAGTVTVDGRLMVEAKACGSKTAIADVVRLVEEAQARTAPVQRLADKVSGVFAYGVIGASLATFAFWAMIGTRVFPQVLAAKLAPGAAAMAAPTSAKLLLSLQLACNVLVVACPCALGLATPTAVLVGTSAAAKQGLLIRGGDVLETASKLDTIVFDKTGTLTYGKPVVVDIQQVDSHSRVEFLKYIAAVEQNSTHPIATAVVAHARQEGAMSAVVEDASFRQEPGSGACGMVEGMEVLIGNEEWLQTHGVQVPEALTSNVPAHNTTIHVGIGGQYAGTLSLRDEVRGCSAHVVQTLRKMGLKPKMLSGDSEAAAQLVGESLGFRPDEIFGGVKPAGKDEVISALKAGGSCVAMVGDGVNDTAALARADVGIAMGGGVDAASDVADIVLMGDRISQVLDALHVSRATFKKIRQNLWWAFGYNIVGIPLAAGALLPSLGIALTPSASGAIMACSSLAVMSNSLLLQLEAHRLVQQSAHDAANAGTRPGQDSGVKVEV